MTDYPSEKPLAVRGRPVDAGALRQIERCLADDEARAGALCADHHLGYSMPIGGIIAYENAVSPSGVGYDIACGNKAIRTNLKAEDVRPDISGVMDAIFQNLEFGMGRRNPDPLDHALVDDPAWTETPGLEDLKPLARSQLGTIGSGNHYVDLFADEADDALWIGIHFGSRGFGHKICAGFLNLARNRGFHDRPARQDMSAGAAVLSLSSSLGADYFAAMKLAGRYAYAGRDYVGVQTLGILGAKSEFEAHNHHNFAWEEEHDGERRIVVRKGATPAWPGQKCFIGGSMGDVSVIAEGVDTPAAKTLLRSTIHGAGRVMSRTKAAGKKKWRKGRMIRQGGAIAPEEMRAWVSDMGVTLRGADTDEAPQAYRRLKDVLKHHEDALRVLHVLKPIGVAMAGPDARDEFRD